MTPGVQAKPTKKATHSVDTLAFTESLGLQTFRKGSRKTWLKHDDQMLLDRLQSLYPSEFASQDLKARAVDWERVAEAFSGERKAKDCRKRWASSLDPNLRRGKWTAEEDELLVRQFRKHGASWQQVASQIAGRTEHQCSKRYYEVLDPNVKNRLQPWTEQEDLLLIELVTKHGTKWKTIAGEFSGRPSLTCRNRWRNLVTAVVRGRASAVIVEKMAGKFDAGSVVGENGVGVKTESEDGDKPGGPHVISDVGVDGMSAEPGAPAKVGENGANPTSASLSASSWEHSKMAASLPQNSPSLAAHPINLTSNVSHNPPPTGHATEWKYSLGGATVPEHEPVKALLAFGGSIHSEHLANYLVQCAAQYNLHVNIHHHHHYQSRGVQENGNSEGVENIDSGAEHQDVLELPGFARLHHEITGSPYFHPDLPASPAPRIGSVEPEAQSARFQHFNYLPPLTPVPRLQSSASSPEHSSKGSVHHHHYHQSSQSQNQPSQNHQNHQGQPSQQNHQYTLREEGDTPRDYAEREGKESDLFRLLNVAELKLDENASKYDESRSSSMTPLTQAVQMAAASDAASAAFYKRSADDASGFYKRGAEEYAGRSKRHRPETLDFLEQVREGSKGASQGQGTGQETGHGVSHGIRERQPSGQMSHGQIGDHMSNPMGAQLSGNQMSDQLGNQMSNQLGNQMSNHTKNMVDGTSAAAYPQQPVSQHHPLHYFTSNTTAPPADLVDEEDEDFFNSWGMYSMRDKPQEPSEMSDESHAWFPFNPS